MAINFVDGKYVNPETGRVTLDPTQYKDWQIAEEAEKTLPSVDFFPCVTAAPVLLPAAERPSAIWRFPAPDSCPPAG